MEAATLRATANANTSFNSDAIIMKDNQKIWIQVVFTGADVVGTLTLEESRDGTNDWQTVGDSSKAVTASGKHIWNYTASGPIPRVVWAYTSGTGNVTVYIVKQDYSETTRFVFGTQP